MKKKVSFLGHFVDVGFAITFHKLQGQTEDKLILLLGQRPGTYVKNISYEGLYVGLTRVQYGDNLRYWNVPLEKLSSFFCQ